MPKTIAPQLNVKALFENGFNEKTARSLYVQGEEIAIFVMMQLAILAKKTCDINGIHPSASVPVFQKEPGTKIVVEAIREYIATKNLPNLPKLRH